MCGNSASVFVNGFLLTRFIYLSNIYSVTLSSTGGLAAFRPFSFTSLGSSSLIDIVSSNSSFKQP